MSDNLNNLNLRLLLIFRNIHLDLFVLSFLCLGLGLNTVFSDCQGLGLNLDARSDRCAFPVRFSLDLLVLSLGTHLLIFSLGLLVDLELLINLLVFSLGLLLGFFIRLLVLLVFNLDLLLGFFIRLLVLELILVGWFILAWNHNLIILFSLISRGLDLGQVTGLEVGLQ